MNSKLLFIYLVVMWFIPTTAQNSQILYDFDEVPQTLLLNPGSDYSHDAFIGVPLLSGISGHGGVTNLSVHDIFADDGRSINDKIREVINKLQNDDSFILNEKIDLLHTGFKLKNGDVLSAGIYQEFDFMFYYPKEIVQFAYEGTATLNQEFSIDGLNFKTDVIGVFHVGISHPIDEKLTIGGRLKFYSGILNAQTKNNRGTFHTSLGTDNLYRHHLLNVDATLQTSGIIFDNYEEIDHKYYLKRMFSFKNPGIGFDLGFTYKPDDQWKITGSVLDIGFIKNKDEVFSYYARGSVETEGIELQFDSDNPQDYWKEFLDDLENKLPIDTLHTKYNSYRPIKVNSAIKYSFGKPHYEECYQSNDNDPYRNSVGAQLFLVNRPIKSQFAATLFYERRFGSFLRTKLTYTIDSYSAKNIGFGLSAKVGVFNLYMAADNLLYLQNVAKANATSFQLGMNIIIDNKFP